MVLRRWISRAALALASVGLSGISAVAQDESAPAAEPMGIVRKFAAQEGSPAPVAPAIEAYARFVVDGAEEVSPYWIGVQLEPPIDILKQHLSLEGGMVVVHVFADGPAAKAGLKANDIILKAGDSFIKEPGDLLKTVGATKENELTLVLIRGGKEKTIKVVPTKRPQPANPQTTEDTDKDVEAALKFTDAFEIYGRGARAAGEERAVDVVRLWSGKLTAELPRSLPKDVSVAITKKGNQPTKVVVKQGDSEYQAEGDQVNQLPEAIRGYVDLTFANSAYGSHALVMAPKDGTAERVRVAKLRTDPSPAAAEKVQVYRFKTAEVEPAGDDSKLDQILKLVSQKGDSGISDLRKEVQQLRKEVEELRKEKK